MNNNVGILVTDFFEKLEIISTSIDIITEEENIFLIKIKTEESGILIGPHGRNLENLQFLLKLMISNLIGNKIKLHLEINDYMKSKDEKLFSFINSKITLVEKNNKDIVLPFYSAYERKKIHGFVSKNGNKDIYTKSIGEGKERRLYICKKDEKLTIDIDGYDI